MTIDEAIKFLEEEIGRQVIYFGGRRDDAIKLGIDALKRTKEQRALEACERNYLLPGETEEEAHAGDSAKSPAR